MSFRNCLQQRAVLFVSHCHSLPVIWSSVMLCYVGWSFETSTIHIYSILLLYRFFINLDDENGPPVSPNGLPAVFVWGDGSGSQCHFINTCHLDSFLTIMCLFDDCHSNFLQTLNDQRSTLAEERMATVISLYREGRLSKAKQIWIGFMAGYGRVSSLNFTKKHRLRDKLTKLTQRMNYRVGQYTVGICMMYSLSVCRYTNNCTKYHLIYLQYSMLIYLQYSTVYHLIYLCTVHVHMMSDTNGRGH